MKAVPRALMQAMSLIRRVMWALPCVAIFHAILLFFEYSDSRFRVAEPRRT
jgi:hypothetical protein